ncbi:hypothetical protein SAMN06265370_11339 [Puniceibacterium sediminis]|uniref:Peptidase propeptide and YPEB domain-containing protein n=1 Tax=Puniceibacterium sediminis TaxID=1608407 RepID=A0A238XVS7_9RHOB|nr:hypothetical protein SAMN06265370_11339 [Puniceibacterium sediminis]
MRFAAPASGRGARAAHQLKRRRFLTAGAACLALCAAPAFAQTAQDQIISQLQEQGFAQIRVSRTWLGRVRILARGQQGAREIILDPGTGTILRDYLDRDDRRSSGSGNSGSGNSGNSDRDGSNGSGSNDDDDRDDDKGGSDKDDSDDDKDDDDNGSDDDDGKDDD